MRDSLSTKEKHKISFQINESFNKNLFYFDKIQYDQHMKFSYDWNNSIYYNAETEEVETGSINMLKQKQNLLSALRMKPKFDRKNDLGIFGQILGYVNAAAAVSLMVVHLNKYYWKEDKKEPKKPKK